MFKYQDMFENKSKLFAITIFFMVAVLAVPLIMPQIHHRLGLFNVLIHFASMTVAIFLSTVAFLAFRKMGTKRLQFTVIAFSMFAISQSALLVGVELANAYYGIFFTELGRLLILATLGIFALSVFRRD